MSVNNMREAIDGLETIFTAYMATGQSLENVVKIYKGGATPPAIEFPCLMIRADTEDREYRRAAKSKVAASDRAFHIVIGCFEYIEDLTLAYESAMAVSEEVMVIIEEDTDIDALGYSVFYDGAIEYGTAEFGRDQAFCYGVLIPILVQVKGRSS